ncbi:MAG TPA: radical SAM protein [Pseudobacteroides sp.]|uniref:radical SAM/SPASM domain-containing protein n=1 Tax=Pseudobacteroides sp. TaxID=1968840 RepID=UPI002F9275AD
MHITLHLTNNCNMACKYCYVNGNKISTMRMETAHKAVDLAAEIGGESIGIIFFGGEPLLKKDLIYETIDYCRWKQKDQNYRFHYKITTNGLLLDEEFIRYSLKENLFIALSFDGIQKAHDAMRVDKSGEGTYTRLIDKLRMIINERPYAPVMLVVSPGTVKYYYESVVFLYEKGFKYIICSLDYSGAWTKEHTDVLKKEYKKLSEFYYDRTIKEEKFYFSPFEVKISSHINCDSYGTERCELGKKQISVAPDGSLYPCVQFVGNSFYNIGSVWTGIDEYKRQELFYRNEEEKEGCKDCAVRKRCNHHCGCLNFQTTGSIDMVSPVLCAHERIVMPVADRLAERLYKKRSEMFIQKHYNDMFPLISLIEDKT